MIAWQLLSLSLFFLLCVLGCWFLVRLWLYLPYFFPRHFSVQRAVMLCVGCITTLPKLSLGFQDQLYRMVLFGGWLGVAAVSYFRLLRYYSIILEYVTPELILLPFILTLFTLVLLLPGCLWLMWVGMKVGQKIDAMMGFLSEQTLTWLWLGYLSATLKAKYWRFKLSGL